MTDRSFVFGVDLDGVVADFYGGLRPIAAEWLGVDLATLPERVSWGLGEWGVDQAPGGYEALHHFAVTQRELFLKLPPMARARRRCAALERRRADSHHHASAVHQVLPPDRRQPDDPVARSARHPLLGPVLHAAEDGRRRRSVHRRLAGEHRAAAGRRGRRRSSFPTPRTSTCRGRGPARGTKCWNWCSPKKGLGELGNAVRHEPASVCTR